VVDLPIPQPILGNTIPLLAFLPHFWQSSRQSRRQTPIRVEHTLRSSLQLSTRPSRRKGWLLWDLFQHASGLIDETNACQRSDSGRTPYIVRGMESRGREKDNSWVDSTALACPWKVHGSSLHAEQIAGSKSKSGASICQRTGVEGIWR
jgi:hypothetical protein